MGITAAIHTLIWMKMTWFRILNIFSWIVYSSKYAEFFKMFILRSMLNYTLIGITTRWSWPRLLLYMVTIRCCFPLATCSPFVSRQVCSRLVLGRRQRSSTHTRLDFRPNILWDHYKLEECTFFLQRMWRVLEWHWTAVWPLTNMSVPFAVLLLCTSETL